IDPMTYIAKGAGAGLSKIGDISAALKGVGNIDIPTLPDGSVHLPDGRLMDPNGNLIAPNGVIDTTPVTHETGPAVPHGANTPTLPAHWTIQGSGQPPVYAGVHAGDGMPHTVDNAAHHNAPGGQFGPPPTATPYGHVPSPSAYDHVPSPSAYDQTPATAPHTGGGHPGGTPWYHQTAGTNPVHDIPTTPHTGGPDVPGPGGHTPDAPHGTGHDLPGGTHADDASHGAGHTDDAAHTGDPTHTGDHTDLGDHVGLGDDAVDGAAHHGTDVPGTPAHQGADVPGSGAGEPFEYKPVMSADDFDNLATDAERHAVAAAELERGTNPYPSSSNHAGQAYGDAYWNNYIDQLDPAAKDALNKYSDFYYTQINGQLRDGAVRPPVTDIVDNMDRVMGTRPVPEDIMVVRGTRIDHLDLDSPLDMQGRTFGDDGYTSTSLGKDPAFEHQPVVMHWRVPKGTPALWIDYISANKGERELLLARGTQYKVTRVFMDSAGKWHAYGEVLPRSH
ncbi:ADP-ribosyltransferase, partial [Streptomyces sp. NPDC059861]|uniref:ADP-ribosyltransferase n=1 Tax=Streptomyces sp. NPDC059861 TaxID=3346974 RepID=UPI003650717F